MHHDIPERDEKGLREFGLVTGAMLVLLFGLFFPWLLGANWPLWPWGIAGVLSLWALIAPGSLHPVYHGWMRVGLVLGWISSRIVLTLLFFGVFTPVGWFLRRRGHDPLHRALVPQAKSYRSPSRPRPKQHMERPF